MRIQCTVVQKYDISSTQIVYRVIWCKIIIQIRIHIHTYIHKYVCMYALKVHYYRVQYKFGKWFVWLGDILWICSMENSSHENFITPNVSAADCYLCQWYTTHTTKNSSQLPKCLV